MTHSCIFIDQNMHCMQSYQMQTCIFLVKMAFIRHILVDISGNTERRDMTHRWIWFKLNKVALCNESSYEKCSRFLKMAETFQTKERSCASVMDSISKGFNYIGKLLGIGFIRLLYGFLIILVTIAYPFAPDNPRYVELNCPNM